jgi:ribosomal protein L39E
VISVGKKGLVKKKKLANANRKIKRIPAFAIIRTKRKVSFNRRRRDWRTDKLRIEE